MAKDKKKVLILGGGFGGVKAALAASQSPKLDVSLISDQENFRYYPTLYRIATGHSHEASSIPLSEIFNDKPVKVIIDSARNLNRKTKTVETSDGKTYSYDYLVIALGVVTNFFGIKGLSRYAFGVKTLEEAQKLRNHLHQQLIDENKPDVNYVIIGGGPTGVELAGDLPAYVRYIMRKHGLEQKAVNVSLVEAEARLLPRMPKPYSLAVQKRLRKLGVKLHLQQKVEAETADNLVVSGRPVKSHTVVWTAGVTNHPFLNNNVLGLDAHGKVLVDQYLQAEPNIYVIGDNASTPYSGLAQTALRDGSFVGNNLARMIEGDAPQPYSPVKPVYITPVGPRWAAMLWGHVQIYGWAGWIMRSAADWIGFRDLQPLLPASKRWAAMGNREESCVVCFKDSRKS